VEIREVRPEKYQEAGRITALAYRELRVGGIPGEGRGRAGSGAGENSAGCHRRWADPRLHERIGFEATPERNRHFEDPGKETEAANDFVLYAYRYRVDH